MGSGGGESGVFFFFADDQTATWLDMHKVLQYLLLYASGMDLILSACDHYNLLHVHPRLFFRLSPF